MLSTYPQASSGKCKFNLGNSIILYVYPLACRKLSVCIYIYIYIYIYHIYIDTTLTMPLRWSASARAMCWGIPKCSCRIMWSCNSHPLLHVPSFIRSISNSCW